MARTKASVGAKVSSGKSSKARCCAAPPPSSSASSGSSERGNRSYSGGNPVCQRETPTWQRPITNFFIGKEPSHGGDDGAGASTSKPRAKRIIYSDDEEESPEKPKNTVLDETIELEPLHGEDSHKIEEYYPKNGKPANGAHIDSDDGVDIENSENGEVNTNGVKDLSDDKSDMNIENGETGTGNGETGKVNGETGKVNGEMGKVNGVNEVVGKGKGVGKKSKNKENLDNNVERRKSIKRDLEEVEESPVSKKLKV